MDNNGRDTSEDHRAAPSGLHVAAVGDLHCKESSAGTMRPLLAQMMESADVLILCGDLTDHGLVAEARILASEITAIPAADRVPILGVLGNHDFETNHVEEVRKILCDAGMTLLDGDATVIEGIGFAGAKGFAGGFGRGTLSAFGEPAVKAFVQEALDEAMKLEAALLRLHTRHKIVILHYAPIRGTVEGEPIEIFPFLGCSRLEDPLNRYQVSAAVHGHAHNGAPEGKTAAGVPVYNVSLPLMRKSYPDHPPFRLLNLPVVEPVADHTGTIVRPAPTEGPLETAVGK